MCPVSGPGLVRRPARDVLAQDGMARRLDDRGLTQPGFGGEPGRSFLQVREVVDHQGRDLIGLTCIDAGDACLVADRGLGSAPSGPHAATPSAATCPPPPSTE
jgi:hypothetical protein